MCKFSTLIFIKPRGSERKIPFIKSCGKCYQCLQSDRAGVVIRAKKEHTDAACTFFVTLKYSDENLIFWNFDRRERRHELDVCRQFGKSKPFDLYGKFILEPRHATNFFKDIQKVIKKINPNLLFRMVLNGEYGTWTHRPHMHVLIFSPVFFSVSDFKKILESVWKYGFVECSQVSDARIVYVSKHTMKEDKGNELQQKVSPIFRRQSSYGGGIGRSLSQDETLLANYYNDANYTYNGRYKVNIPRYIKKKLHPDTYSEEELIEMSKQSYNTLVEKIFNEFGIKESHIVPTLLGCMPADWLKKYDINKYDITTSAGVYILKFRCAVALYRNRNIDSVKDELRQYYENKFQKHKQKLKQNGYFDDDI